MTTDIALALSLAPFSTYIILVIMSQYIIVQRGASNTLGRDGGERCMHVGNDDDQPYCVIPELACYIYVCMHRRMYICDLYIRMICIYVHKEDRTEPRRRRSSFRRAPQANRVAVGSPIIIIIIIIECANRSANSGGYVSGNQNDTVPRYYKPRWTIQPTTPIHSHFVRSSPQEDIG